MFRLNENEIELSINPTYFCNFNCTFCYLTKKQLRDKTYLDLIRLEEMMLEVMSYGKKISAVCLYGGEVLTLSNEYINDLVELLCKYNIEDISLNTNLSTLKRDIIYNPDIHISVSYDFGLREKDDVVLRNINKLNRPISLMTVGTNHLFSLDSQMVINLINSISNCESWEIKPYSKNQSNQFDYSYKNLEHFIRKIISSKNKRFEFTNETFLIEQKKGLTNGFSDDHIYISPTGKFTVLEFDKNNNEFFLELNSFEEYLNWSENEKRKFNVDSYCSNCNYLGNCLSEHMRDVSNFNEKGCSGLYNLIKWYNKHDIIN